MFLELHRLPFALGAGLWARDLEPYMMVDPLRSLGALAIESSLLMDGLRDLGSSLLLLCRWWCPGKCTMEWPDRPEEDVLGGF